MKTIKFIKIIIVIIVITFIIKFPLVRAQSEIPLTLANARNEVALDPGESYRFAMKLYNRGENPILGNLKLVDFIVTDNKGTPSFLEGDNSLLSNKYSAASWMSLPFQTMAIPPNDKVSFDVTVNVPFDAKPGGHYAAVIFEATSNFTPQEASTNQEAGSAITPRIAGLFYIRVNGKVTEKALITKLTVPPFSEYGPVAASAEITNSGDTHIQPKGFLTVFDWFGRVVTQSKLDEVNIFPEVARIYENKVGEHLMVGRYKLAFSATYGEKGTLLEGFTYFWVIPWRMIVIIALSLAILILLLKNWKRNTFLHQKQMEKKLAEEEKELENLKEELKNRS